MSKVTILYDKPRTSGNREGWAKIITGTNPKEKGAKAFEGDYLVAGVQQELDEGTLILRIWWTGSVKNGHQMADIARVTKDGLEDATGNEWEWRREFVDLRKTAQALLDEKDKGEITTEKFNEKLEEIVQEMTVAEIIAMPGVYEIVSEELNNEVLKALTES